jgi:hypothetical protein
METSKFRMMFRMILISLVLLALLASCMPLAAALEIWLVDLFFGAIAFTKVVRQYELRILNLSDNPPYSMYFTDDMLKPAVIGNIGTLAVLVGLLVPLMSFHLAVGVSVVDIALGLTLFEWLSDKQGICLLRLPRPMHGGNVLPRSSYLAKAA